MCCSVLQCVATSCSVDHEMCIARCLQSKVWHAGGVYVYITDAMQCVVDSVL